MDVYVRLTCPNCHRPNLKVRLAYLGQVVRCKHCKATFRAGGGATEGTEAALSADAANPISELDALREDRDRLLDEVEALRRRVEELSAEAENARRAEERSLREALAELAAMRHARNAEADAFRVERATLAEDQVTLQARLNELETHLGEVTADAAARIAELQAERDRLAVEAAEARRQSEPEVPTAHVVEPATQPEPFAVFSVHTLPEPIGLDRHVPGAPLGGSRPSDAEWSPPGPPGGLWAKTRPPEVADGGENDAAIQDRFLINVVAQIRAENERLTHERDEWKREAQQLRGAVLPVERHLPGTQSLANGAVPIERSLTSPTSWSPRQPPPPLAVQFDVAVAEALADITEEADERNEEAFTLATELSKARSEIARLRRSLSLLGADPDASEPPRAVKIP